MSLAEYFEAGGEARGLKMGKILNMQALLGMPETPAKELEALTQGELEELHASLRREFERSFRRQ